MPFAVPPGEASFPPELQDRLAEAFEKKGANYFPHTRHRRSDGAPLYANRLLFEASPYLLQHAHNPVNWRAWDEEAFEAARLDNRPILLSVGYSTCHWCHVMAEESFEDEEIAQFINENYVPVKVDREERPDIDAVYMHAVQQLTGAGGWPMTVWLTPEKKPFFAGSYFPPRDGDRGAHAGFLTLLERMAQTYRDKPDRVENIAGQLVDSVRTEFEGDKAGDAAGVEALQKAFEFYAKRFDAAHGGLTGAPKFPSSLPVRLLLREFNRTGDANALAMAEKTLHAMADGGMHDQIGGGFHRYAVDDAWLVPHFEKMLYDNATLAVAYLEGWQAIGEPRFGEIARGILRCIENDLTSPEGVFFAATDADSPAPGGEQEEGRYYTWTPHEIDAALDPRAAALIAAHFGVQAAGNFEGRSVLYVARPLADVAGELDLPIAEAERTLSEARERLAASRRRRPAPFLDNKIITGWNGLAISAFARAALILGDDAYRAAADRAADFIDARLTHNGRLLHVWIDGEARVNAFLSDYAFTIAANLDLFEATHEQRRLERAIALSDVLERHYWDKNAGGFFMTADDHEPLPARDKPFYDAGEPSGNAAAIMNLLRLHELTSDDRWRRLADAAIGAFGDVLRQVPVAMSETLLAIDFLVDKPKEIVIVTPAGDGEGLRPFLDALRGRFVPNRVLVTGDEAALAGGLGRIVPLAARKTAKNGLVTAYVCEHGVCYAPTNDPREFAALLTSHGN